MASDSSPGEGSDRPSARGASEIAITNHGQVAHKMWIFDSDGSAPEGITLLSGSLCSFTLKNQHTHFMYSVGFDKVEEWNSNNPDEQLDTNELGVFLLDVGMHPLSEVRWDVVSWFPSEVIQGNDQSTPGKFTIEVD